MVGAQRVAQAISAMSKFKGEYDSSATYTTGDIVYQVIDGREEYFIRHTLSGTHATPPNESFWWEITNELGFRTHTVGTNKALHRYNLVLQTDTNSVKKLFFLTQSITTNGDLSAHPELYIRIDDPYEVPDQAEAEAGTATTARVWTAQRVAQAIAALATGTGTGFALRFGVGAPNDSLGSNGDWYINTTTGGFYEKAAGSWELRYTDQVGAGGGLTESQVDARVTAGVADWAEDGNADVLPDAKIPSGVARDTEVSFIVGTQVAALVQNWAEVGNTDDIPENRLPSTITRDSELAVYAVLAGALFTGATGGVTPVNDSDFTTKEYVDAEVAGMPTPTPQSESIYYGIVGQLSDVVDGVESSLTSEQAAVAGHNITLGPSALNDYFLILVPNDHDLLTLINAGTQANAKSAYARTENAVEIGGVQYISYTLGPLNSGVTITYRLTLQEGS